MVFENLTNQTLVQVNRSEFASGLVDMNLGFLTETSYFGNTLWQYILFAIVFVGSFLIAKVVYFILKHKVSKMASRTKTQFDEMIISIIKGPLSMAISIIGLTIALQFLTLEPGMLGFFSALLSVLISIAFIWFFMRFVEVFVDAYIVPRAAKTDSKLDDEIVPVLKKALKALVIIFGILSMASNFGYDITAMIAVLGVAGIGIGFALKDTMENMLSGVLIYMDRPFRIGDRIKLADGTYGDITDVGLRSSKIKNLDNNIVIIPNSKMINTVVENYVMPSKKLKQSFNIGLVYETSPKKMKQAIKIIEDAIKTTEGVTSDEPIIRFMGFGDFSLNLLCLYWIKSLKYWDSKHFVNMKILEEFEKAGISIAFPTQTIHMGK
jgi:MscS family membrane protein